MNQTSTNQTSQPNNQREAIVDKLHGALSILRRERDDLHRSKELAMERLNLAKDERINGQENLSVLQIRFNKIDSIDGKQVRLNDIGKLQSDVDRLSREVSSGVLYCSGNQMILIE
jgi:hypothetical protein